MKPTSTPHVALLIETSMGWGRRMIQGAIEYAHQHGPWLLWVEPNALEPEIHLPPGWKGDGIIARVATQSMARHIRSTGLPCVNISSIELAGINYPRVTSDFRTLARHAAEYLLDRGFRNFGYCGPRQRMLVNYHYDGFADAVHAAGCTCASYRLASNLKRHSASWLAQQEDLIAWLRSLPKPAAVLTWFVQHGRDVINACRMAEILVPEEVAVLASDDDSLLCDACLPPLSGIASNSTQTGYRAAALLDRLMRGDQPPKKPIFIEPGEIVSRQSTETLAIADANIAQAVAFIRMHAGDLIQVKDVLQRVPLSRRQLELDFQRILGRSPAQEIRRVHLERAKQLLAGTDLSIPRVAAASGFGTPEHFTHAFKKQFGCSPLRLRQQVRGH